MTTAKLFKHGGSQAVRLPKAYRFDGVEVFIERRGDEVVLRPKIMSDLQTLHDVARFMRELHAGKTKFPAREQPKAQQERDLTW